MKPYNGYSNYPTWNVALWIDNEEGLYNQRLEIMQRAGTSYDASKALKTWYEETFPSPETGPQADILGYAMDHVDWLELAEHWWDEREESVTNSDGSCNCGGDEDGNCVEVPPND